MQDRELLAKVAQDVAEIKVALTGYDGHNGLLHKVERQEQDIKALNQFKRNLYIFLAFLGGSGALGTGVWWRLLL